LVDQPPRLANLVVWGVKQCAISACPYEPLQRKLTRESAMKKREVTKVGKNAGSWGEESKSRNGYSAEAKSGGGVGVKDGHSLKITLTYSQRVTALSSSFKAGGGGRSPETQNKWTK